MTDGEKLDLILSKLDKMASLIHFRITLGKCIKSAYGVLICGDLLLVCCLYDGIFFRTHFIKQACPSTFNP